MRTLCPSPGISPACSSMVVDLVARYFQNFGKVLRSYSDIQSTKMSSEVGIFTFSSCKCSTPTVFCFVDVVGDYVAVIAPNGVRYYQWAWRVLEVGCVALWATAGWYWEEAQAEAPRPDTGKTALLSFPLFLSSFFKFFSSSFFPFILFRAGLKISPKITNSMTPTLKATLLLSGSLFVLFFVFSVAELIWWCFSFSFQRKFRGLLGRGFFWLQGNGHGRHESENNRVQEFPDTSN